MKKILLLALASCLLFTSCSKKARNLSESEKFSEETGEVISSGEETIEATSSEEEDTEEGFIPAEIPELIAFPERVSLELGQETELLKTEEFNGLESENSLFTDIEIVEYPKEVNVSINEEVLIYRCSEFTLYMLLKGDVKEDRAFGAFYSYDIILADSNNKKVIFSGGYSVYELEKNKENPLIIYDFLSTKVPVVKGDIDNDGIDEYLFVIREMFGKDMLAIRLNDVGYENILECQVHMKGGPEEDAFAENIIFDNSNKEITIDYRPYNHRHVFSYDEEKKSYNEKEYQYNSKMEFYKPNQKGIIKTFGNRELLVLDNEDRIYLKDNSKFYKVYFEGDKESRWGYKLLHDSIKVIDINENDFLVTMEYVNKDYGTSVPLYKEQIFYIWKENDVFNMVTCFNNEEYGYSKNENEEIKLTKITNENDEQKLFFDIVNKETSEIVKSDSILINKLEY
ncbi:MAG: hypothetical protein J5710_07975 [Treponema sp.]|nr:hypothetical protein [Treponema sp.]MBR5645779.1 hypothetical protein [Treponema sp.]